MKGEKQLEGCLGPTCQLTGSLTSTLLPLSSQPNLTVPPCQAALASIDCGYGEIGTPVILVTNLPYQGWIGFWKGWMSCLSIQHPLSDAPVTG